MLMAGMALFVAASIACALATSIEMLIVARGVQAIGGASGMILSRAIVRDMFSREKSASVLGYITMAWVVAPMVAPAIGGILDQHFTFRASFWLLAMIGAMVLAGAVASLPETNLNLQPDASLIRTKLYAQLLRNKAFRGYTATISFGAAVFFLYLAVAPYIIITVRGHSPVEYGMWTIVAALGYMAGNFASGRYSEAMRQRPHDRLWQLADAGGCGRHAGPCRGRLYPPGKPVSANGCMRLWQRAHHSQRAHCRHLG